MLAGISTGLFFFALDWTLTYDIGCVELAVDG